MQKNDFISREAAIEVFCKFCDIPKPCAVNCIDVCRVKEIPAADVRPVVLCRDCKWCHSGYCEKYDDLIPFGCANRPWEDWFCADGERPNCGADMRSVYKPGSKEAWQSLEKAQEDFRKTAQVIAECMRGEG